MNTKTGSSFDFSIPGNAASSVMFPPSTSGMFGGASASSNAPFSSYLLPSQTPWAGAALNAQSFANVLTPNHPYLQVLKLTFNKKGM